MQRRAQRHRERPDDRAPREEKKPPRKSGISDALRWMDESGTARPPAEARPQGEKVDREAVAQGRRPIQVRPGGEQPREKSKDPAKPKKKSKPAARKASASGPLEPIRRPKKEPPPTPAWGDAASRPPSAKLEEALSWMDSAEAKPLPDAPPPGQRPATGKVEAVLSWMDELSGPFEEVVRGPRRTQKRSSEQRPPERSERPSAAPPPGPAAQEAPARRPSTGKLKREAVNELLARADRVAKRPSAPPPPPPLPSPAADESSELGPPESGFGPLSASDVWMLAQTPEDVLAGARRPQTAEALPPAPPLPPPTPRRIASPAPVDEQQRDTRRAKVDELLEWTQDLLGALEDSDTSSADDLVVPEEPVLPASDAGRSARSTDVCELVLSAEDHPSPDPDPEPPEPPRRRSSRLFRLQQQLEAMPQPPSWSALPDPDALARLQRSASSALGAAAPDPFRDDPLAGLDPYASVLPPVPEVPRDPRCRDPFCTDPRCLQGEATPPPPPAPPAPPGSWGKKVRIVRPGAA